MSNFNPAPQPVRAEQLPLQAQLRLAAARAAVAAAALLGVLSIGPMQASAQLTIDTLPPLEVAANSLSTNVLLPDALVLPDAPGFVVRPEGGFGGGQTAVVRHSNKLDKVVDPGYSAERLTIGDKVLLGIRENATISSVAGWVFSAAYEQVTDGSPNYGHQGKAFAQRLGAATARNVSETIFSDSLIAPILHEDPRYYKMGSGHSFIKRLAYSGTRGIITRTDGGRQTINFANIGGDLGGSALTQLYYPPINRNITQVMSTWGGSVAGDAVGYVVDEFLTDALTTLHLKKSQ